MSAAGLIVDVHNGNPIDAQLLRLLRPAGLIAKATEGTGFEDAFLHQHRAAAKACGVPFGSYLFLHPGSDGSEADFYQQYAKPQPGELVAVDVEVSDGEPMQKVAARAHSCLQRLVALGHFPGLYCSSSWWGELVACQPALRHYWVWEAQYPGHPWAWSPRLLGLRAKLRRGASVKLWQFTDHLAAPGGRFFDASRPLVPVADLFGRAGL